MIDDVVGMEGACVLSESYTQDKEKTEELVELLCEQHVTMDLAIFTFAHFCVICGEVSDDVHIKEYATLLRDVMSPQEYQNSARYNASYFFNLLKKGDYKESSMHTLDELVDLPVVNNRLF